MVEEKEEEPAPAVSPVFQTQVLEESMGGSNSKAMGKPGLLHLTVNLSWLLT